LKHIKHQWRTYGGTPRAVPSHRDSSLPHIEERALHRKSGANQRRYLKSCLPMGTIAANLEEQGDFGTAPSFGQLFGQTSACL